MMVERPHADLDHGARFTGDIRLTGWIVAEQHHGKSGHDAMRGAKPLRLGFHRGAQIGGDSLAVNDSRAHVPPFALHLVSRSSIASSIRGSPAMRKRLIRAPSPAAISTCRGAS